VKHLKQVACDDAGRVLNPMLLEGQIHGGVAQGTAQALLEEVRYDSDGNPITSNLADYAMISAAELGDIEVVHMETPTFINALGAKGIGESGTIGSTPAVQSAVIDAVSHLGVRHIDMPTTAERVWRAIAAAQGLSAHSTPYEAAVAVACSVQRMTATDSPIVASGLVRHFGSDGSLVRAVDGVDLEVHQGEIFGLLGPNGSGKSTTVRMLTTLLRPTDGSARVAGFDVVRQADNVRRSIGVALQDAAIDPLMTGNELLELQAVLYGIAPAAVRRRADELLERVGLTAAADRRVGRRPGEADAHLRALERA
jgi:hypothetical protein